MPLLTLKYHWLRQIEYFFKASLLSLWNYPSILDSASPNSLQQSIFRQIQHTTPNQSNSAAKPSSWSDRKACSSAVLVLESSCKLHENYQYEPSYISTPPVFCHNKPLLKQPNREKGPNSTIERLRTRSITIQPQLRIKIKPRVHRIARIVNVIRVPIHIHVRIPQGIIVAEKRKQPLRTRHIRIHDLHVAGCKVFGCAI